MNELYFETHVFCCTNERPLGHKRGCCAEKNADGLRAYMKARVKELGIPKARINNSGCLDRCEEGPVMVVYPDGVWYRPTNKEDVEEIIQSHIIGKKIVERLKI